MASMTIREVIAGPMALRGVGNPALGVAIWLALFVACARNDLAEEFASREPNLIQIRDTLVGLGPDAGVLSVSEEIVELSSGGSVPWDELPKVAAHLVRPIGEVRRAVQDSDVLNAGIYWNGAQPEVFVIISAFGGVLGTNRAFLWVEGEPSKSQFDVLERIPGQTNWYFYRQ